METTILRDTVPKNMIEGASVTADLIEKKRAVGEDCSVLETNLRKYIEELASQEHRFSAKFRETSSAARVRFLQLLQPTAVL